MSKIQQKGFQDVRIQFTFKSPNNFQIAQHQKEELNKNENRNYYIN